MRLDTKKNFIVKVFLSLDAIIILSEFPFPFTDDLIF